MESFNCIVCANEFQLEEFNKHSSLNKTAYKICNSCMDKCNPIEDYKIARNIVNSYINASSFQFETESNFSEVKDILNERK